MRKRIFGFERNIFFLSLTSFLSDVSSEIIYPLVPIFLTSVLNAGTTFVGLVEGIAESTASLLKLFSGWLSDKIRKRKILVVLGYTLSSITRPLMAVAIAPWHVLALRFTDRIGKGIRNSPRDALIVDSCALGERGRSFGFNRAMDHAGAMIGSLIVFILLFGVTKNLRLVFMLASIPALFAVVAVTLFTYEVISAKVSGNTMISRDTAVPDTLAISYGKKFKFFMLAILVFTLGNSSDAFLLLRAKNIGVGVTFIPLLWFLLHLVKSITSTPAGVISDKIGRRRIILLGWLIYAIVYFGFGFVKSLLQVWFLFAAYGLFYGLTEGVERALVSDLVPQEEHGRAYGIYNFIIGITALPASLIMGVLWQAFGPKVAFLFGSVLALFASVVLAMFVKEV
ncbi:MAG: MFS transporter [Candidatus Omnitrophica bacterium]|nr:MFS transporter [Candidatus Omnitrophota bacterium]